jgi:integrase
VYPPSRRFPDGVRSFGVWYRVAGRSRQKRLGRHPAVTLKAARDQARAIVEAARVRRVDIGAIGQVGTLAELVAAFIAAARAEKPRTRADSTLASYEQMLRSDLKGTRVGRMPFTDLRRGDVRELLRAKATVAPAVATNLRRMLVAASRWGLREEVLEHDPMAGVESIGGSTSGARVLRDEEIVILWRACAEEAAAMKSAALERGRGRNGAKWTRERKEDERAAAAQRAVLARVLLLTAQRSGETAAMEWPELDRDSRLWHIPAEHRKGQRGMRRAHVVPLSEAAKEELRLWSLHPLVGSGARVFPWALAQHRHWIDPLRDRARTLGLVEHWSPHDLRRTAASGMARLGFTRSVIALVLGHTMHEGGAVTGVYDRFDRMPERAAALEAWGAHVAALVTSPRPPS